MNLEALVQMCVFASVIFWSIHPMILNQLFVSPWKPNRRSRLTRQRTVETLEVRTLLTSAPFQQLSLYATTVMPEASPDFTYQAADWDGNSITDIMVVQSFGTASGKVEVSVYSTEYPTFNAQKSPNNGAWHRGVFV